MAATVQISESNTGSETVQDNVANINMGSLDDHELTPASNPIIAGQNSFEKYNRVKLVSLAGSTLIKNIKVWRTGALSGSDAHKTCARESGYVEKSFATPTTTTSTQATETMPSSEPSGANLGIDGSLTGQLDADSEYSDYLVHQLQTNAGTTAGASTTLNFKYEEVA